MRNRAASGRIARKNARAQTQTAYRPMIRPDTPARWSRRAGQQDHEREDEADGQVERDSAARADGRPGGPAPRDGTRDGARTRRRYPRAMTSIGLVGPHQRLDRALGRRRPAAARRVHRVARVRGAAAGPAAVLHRAGRGPRAPRGRHRRLARGPPHRRADVRLAGRSDGARPADGRRAHRRPGVFSLLPLVFTGPLAFLILRAGAGLVDGGLRPGRPRLPDRRDAAGAPRRGLRAVRRVPDGRAAARARRSAPSAPRGSAGSRSCSCSAASPRGWPPSRSPCADARPVSGRTRPRRRTRPSSRRTPRRPHAAPPPTSTPTADPAGEDRRSAPTSLWNRGLIAVLVINAGGYFAGGTYEVIWSLFLQHLGAGLDLIGLTFAMFGLPVLLLSPFAGRLVDRRGALAFIVIGSILPAMTGLAYTRIADPLLAVPLILIEATGFAMLNPALYAVVAANSPVGRSSTAQGIFGAAGTVGFIVASLIAGVLAADEHRLPDVRLQRRPAVQSRASGCSSAAGGDCPAEARCRPPDPPPFRPLRLGTFDRIGLAPYSYRSRGGAAAARRAHNPKVRGSNPLPATKPPSPEPRARPPGVLPLSGSGAVGAAGAYSGDALPGGFRRPLPSRPGGRPAGRDVDRERSDRCRSRW